MGLGAGVLCHFPRGEGPGALEGIEKGHYCLIVALRELFVGPGELEASIGDDLELCMDIRHEADYGLVSSGESAGLAVRSALRAVEAARDMLRDGPT